MEYREQIERFVPSCEQEQKDRRLILDYIRLFPDDILTRANEIAHITASGLILNESLDRVLLIHHNIYNTWAWTGGHADGDRDLLAVALKEAREETGVADLRPLTGEMLSLDICPVFGHMKRGRYVCAHQHLNGSYVLIAPENAALTAKPDENSGVQWFSLEEMQTAVNEPYFLEIYLKMIRRARALQ